VSENGGQHGETEAYGQHGAQPVGNQVGCRTGDDEHGDHQNTADTFEGRNGGGRHQRHQCIMHDIGVDAHGRSQGRIESSNFEFLEKYDHEAQVDQQHDSAGNGSPGNVMAQEQGGVQRSQLDGPVQDAAGVQIDMIGRLTNENQAHGEQGGENHTHGGPAIQAAEPVDSLDHQGGDHADENCTHQHGQAVPAAGYQKGDGQARQHGVADGIAHHAHAPQYQIIA
jgi:hypothetical protein